MIKLATSNEKQTRAFARRFARRLKGGDVVLLEGELGAGKTTFVKGLAEAFGIKEKIKSPTFVLMRVHRLAHSRRQTADGKLKRAVSRKLSAVSHFVHVDAYRVKSARELEDIGLADWLGRHDTIVVVEWGEKIKPLLKGRRYMVIKFQHGKKPTERVIKVTASVSTHLRMTPKHQHFPLPLREGLGEGSIVCHPHLTSPIKGEGIDLLNPHGVILGDSTGTPSVSF